MTLDDLFKLHDTLSTALRTVDEELLQHDWRHIANRGYKLLAIRGYLRTKNCKLSEAKEAVEAFLDLIK